MRRTAAAGVLVALALPAILYIVLPFAWELRYHPRLRGDEPHYLIIADALLHDRSLDVRRAYDRDPVNVASFGRADRFQHVYTGEHGTYSVHDIGIPVLVAPLYGALGVFGARLTVALLVGLVPLLFYLVCRLRTLGIGESLWLSLCASLGMPFLVASGQIYPDLVAGVVLLGLACVALALTGQPVSRLMLFAAGLAAAVLPWLHIKNVVAGIILIVLILLLDLRQRRWHVRVGRVAWAVVPIACSVLLFGWFNRFSFGSPWGPYPAGRAAGATASQASMIFLGLLFDQSQGIFVQQPFFLFALPGLAIFVRRSPWVAAGLVAAAASVLIPNSFHDCWYGCYSVAGRFMWTVAPLWFVPLVFLYAALRRGRVLLLAGGALALAWQLWLARVWLPWGPLALYFTGLSQRDSLFSGLGRRLLPSFYDFDRYRSYPPNVVSLAVGLTLVAAGIVMAVRLSRLRSGEQAAAVSEVEVAAERPRLRTRRSPGLAWAAAVVVVAAAGLVAARLNAPPREVLLRDLVKTLDQAEQRPANGVGRFPVLDQTIAGETRLAILALPTSRITWRVSVPPHARFRAAMGIDERVWDGEGDGVLFRVSIDDGVRYRDVASKPLMPRKFQGDRRWVPVDVDLSEYAGRQINLILNTNTDVIGPYDPRNDVAYWGAPAIYITR